MSEKLTQEASTSSKSKGRWQPLLNLCQVVQLRGKLWNKYGISVNGSNFLYPEEVLFLFDSHKIEVENPSNPAAFWTKQELYNKALQIIPLSVYLVYMKLKSLEYIVVRHKKAVRIYKDDAELYDHLRQNPTRSLLESLVSFNLYIEPQGFTKKKVTNNDIVPVAYVAILDGPNMLSPRVLLALLAEAGKVPVILGIVTSTGSVILQEFTDALQSLALTNEPELPPVESKSQMKKRLRREQEKQKAIQDKAGTIVVDAPAVASPPIEMEL